MIETLLFHCPFCGRPDSIVTRGKTRCISCGVHFERHGGQVLANGELYSAASLYDKIRDLTQLPFASSGETILLASEWATLKIARPFQTWHSAGCIHSTLELGEKVARGRLEVTPSAITFIGPEFNRRFPLDQITCVTTDSNHFILKVRGEPYYFIDFETESPLKYEVLLRRILQHFWRQKGLEIIEFQPRIDFTTKRDGKSGLLKLSNRVVPRDRLDQKLVYHLLRALAGVLFRLVFNVRVVGQEHIPSSGPCLIILNHEGYWDAYFGQTLLKRRVAFLAKNSEFKNPLFRYVLQVFRAVPVKRYMIDPASVRSALRLLAAGHAVGIFWEGERTWDGRFLPPKRSTVKLLIRAGVPVVPVRIRGSFDTQPRWGRDLQRHPVTLHAAAPIHFNPDETDLQEATERITTVLNELGN